MDKKKTLTIDDIPSIEELKERFANRELVLQRTLGRPAKDVLKYKCAMTNQFIINNHSALEPQDQELSNTAYKKLVKYGLLSFIVPSAINISLGKATDQRIYDLHFLTRASLRLAFYVVPLFFFTNYSLAMYTRVSMYLNDKYCDRVEEFLKTRDPKIINPYIKD